MLNVRCEHFIMPFHIVQAFLFQFTLVHCFNMSFLSPTSIVCCYLYIKSGKGYKSLSDKIRLRLKYLAQTCTRKCIQNGNHACDSFTLLILMGPLRFTYQYHKEGSCVLQIVRIGCIAHVQIQSLRVSS